MLTGTTAEPTPHKGDPAERPEENLDTPTTTTTTTTTAQQQSKDSEKRPDIGKPSPESQTANEEKQKPTDPSPTPAPAPPAAPDANGEEKKRKAMSEGVEVVLDGGNSSTILDQDQNVFRAPNPVRPRPMRAPSHPVKGSGSYGYGGGGGGGPSDYGHGPYPYDPSASFEEGAYPPVTASHYSPHVQYPQPTRHGESVNVISPNQKDHSTGHRPPTSSRRGGGHQPYQYPPPPGSPGPSGGHHSPPRMRGYHMRRPEGPYSAAQRSRSHPERRHTTSRDDSWGYPSPDRPRPPIVAEASFDSEHYPPPPHVSNPTTPNAPHYGPPMHHSSDHYHHQQGPPPQQQQQQQRYDGESYGSFESSAAPGHYDQRGYYGRPSPHYPPPPESPYTPYSHGGGYPGYSPGGYRDYYSPQSDYSRRYSYSYEDEYGHGAGGKKNPSGMMLPEAAEEVDFDVTDPPSQPIVKPSKAPICESPADVNSYDVLCGRGGGTNSQIGNRRFRKLVQDFQPTYLLARRKEKPLLARTIVLIIRKRGGRFLKKDDETGELYEVGDAKAEAKTSQALREGLDVRATKSASNVLDKKKKKKASSTTTAGASASATPVSSSSKNGNEEKEALTPSSRADSPVAVADVVVKPSSGGRKSPEAPPSLPTLNQNQRPPTPPSPPSPNSVHFRKRRRMRSSDASVGAGAGCGMGFQDKLFPDFCPPRADLGRVASPTMEMAMDGHFDHHGGGGSNREMKFDHHHHDVDVDDDDIIYAGTPPSLPRHHHHHSQHGGGGGGCGGIAFDIVTGAAASSFCLGPRKWR